MPIRDFGRYAEENPTGAASFGPAIQQLLAIGAERKRRARIAQAVQAAQGKQGAKVQTTFDERGYPVPTIVQETPEPKNAYEQLIEAYSQRMLNRGAGAGGSAATAVAGEEGGGTLDDLYLENIGPSGPTFASPESQRRKEAADIAKERRQQQTEIEKEGRQKQTKIEEEEREPSAGQKAIDQEFGKEYVAFKASGGFADVAKNLVQLREAEQTLKTRKDISGPVLGTLHPSLQAILAPKALATRENIEEVVQRNLRIILGPAFTEKEGERLIRRSFNPSLSEAENSKRLNRLIKQITAAAKAKQDASNYFEENGTLKGWQGKLYTISDFDVSGGAGESAGKAGADGFTTTPGGNKFKVRTKSNGG